MTDIFDIKWPLLWSLLNELSLILFISMIVIYIFYLLLNKYLNSKRVVVKSDLVPHEVTKHPKAYYIVKLNDLIKDVDLIDRSEFYWKFLAIFREYLEENWCSWISKMSLSEAQDKVIIDSHITLFKKAYYYAFDDVKENSEIRLWIIYDLKNII